MNIRETAAVATCPGDRLHADPFAFEEGRHAKTAPCPRTIEILTALNDVFDGLAPGQSGILRTADGL